MAFEPALNLRIKAPPPEEELFFCFHCNIMIKNELDCFCDQLCYDEYIWDVKAGVRAPDFTCLICREWMDPLEAKWNLMCSWCEDKKRAEIQETPTYNSDDWSSEEEPLYTPAEEFMLNPSIPSNTHPKDKVILIVNELLVLIQDAQGKALKARYSYFFFLYLLSQGTKLFQHSKLRTIVREKMLEWQADDYVMSLYDFASIFKKLEECILEKEKED